MPTPKQLLACPEYQNFERKREVLCEITPLDIKASANDSLRLLVFKFNKNDKGDKKRDDNNYNLMGMGNFKLNDDDHKNLYDEFKQISVIEESEL